MVYILFLQVIFVTIAKIVVKTVVRIFVTIYATKKKIAIL